ncbi:MAG TPA: carboxypeptidase regulatory-like domain-containing protein [Pyrinomonadaceae bacterium]|nr:carboxypeptidase regulatory-like domain-containing protein [Pyrinomonadaceae bacterium]
MARPTFAQAEAEKAKAEGLAGIKVTITGPGGSRRELFTDAEGRYEVTHLKPGKYKVGADLPPQYYRDEYTEKELEVYDRGCASAHFAAIPNGVVSGRVVTAEGEPVAKAKVVLVRADLEGPGGMGDEAGVDYMEDKEGRFEIGQVPPGEYVLGVNVTWMPQPHSPYPPTYYPGAADRSGAAVIKVGLGERVADLLLRLPPPLAGRKVHGVVVWPDGTPAAGAEVYLSDVNYPDHTATGWDHKTDAQGRFTLTGLEGVTYRVHANAPKYPDKPYGESGIMHAEPPKVTLSSDAYGLRLVLASEGAVCKHYAGKK